MAVREARMMVCSFCGRSSQDARLLIKGGLAGAAICERCVSECVRIVCHRFSLTQPVEDRKVEGIAPGGAEYDEG